jgi:outer membrane protein assembly factor BamB
VIFFHSILAGRLVLYLSSILFVGDLFLSTLISRSSNALVLACGINGSVYALNHADGSLVWKMDTGGPFFASSRTLQVYSQKKKKKNEILQA